LVGTSSRLRCQWVMDDRDATQVFMFEFKLQTKGGEFHRALTDRECHPVLLVRPRTK